MNETYSTPQIARLLSRSEQQVRRYIKLGQLQANQIGERGHYVVHRQVIEEFAQRYHLRLDWSRIEE